MEQGLIRLTGTDKIMKEINQAQTLQRAGEKKKRMQRLEDEIKELVGTGAFKSLQSKCRRMPLKEIIDFLKELDKTAWESLALQRARSKMKLFWVCSSPVFGLMLFLQSSAVSAFFTKGIEGGLVASGMALMLNCFMGLVIAMTRTENSNFLLFRKIRKLKKLGGREIMQALGKGELEEVKGRWLIRGREIKELEAEKNKKEKSLRPQEKAEKRKVELAKAQTASLEQYLKRISKGSLNLVKIRRMIEESQESVFKMTKENATKRCRIYGGALGLGACGLVVGVSLLGPVFAFASFALAPLFFGFLNNHWLIKKGCFWGGLAESLP